MTEDNADPCSKSRGIDISISTTRGKFQEISSIYLSCLVCKILDEHQRLDGDEDGKRAAHGSNHGEVIRQVVATAKGPFTNDVS